MGAEKARLSFSAPFWLLFVACGLLLLAPRTAAVDFSPVALAGLPGLGPALVQPVAGEKGAPSIQHREDSFCYFWPCLQCGSSWARNQTLATAVTMLDPEPVKPGGYPSSYSFKQFSQLAFSPVVMPGAPAHLSHAVTYSLCKMLCFVSAPQDGPTQRGGVRLPSAPLCWPGCLGRP